jgi:hypothetical protein
VVALPVAAGAVTTAAAAAYALTTAAAAYAPTTAAAAYAPTTTAATTAAAAHVSATTPGSRSGNQTTSFVEFQSHPSVAAAFTFPSWPLSAGGIFRSLLVQLEAQLSNAIVGLVRRVEWILLPHVVFVQGSVFKTKI